MNNLLTYLVRLPFLITRYPLKTTGTDETTEEVVIFQNSITPFPHLVLIGRLSYVFYVSYIKNP